MAETASLYPLYVGDVFRDAGVVSIDGFWAAREAALVRDNDDDEGERAVRVILAPGRELAHRLRTGAASVPVTHTTFPSAQFDDA
jgi:hypothetical protein